MLVYQARPISLTHQKLELGYGPTPTTVYLAQIDQKFY